MKESNETGQRNQREKMKTETQRKQQTINSSMVA